LRLKKRLGLLVIFTASLVYWVSARLVVVLSDSIEPVLLWKVEGQPAKRDYVNFEFQHKLLGDKPFSMTKRVGCFAGELLERKANMHFYCAGRYLGVTKTTSVDGRPMPLFAWDNSVIPAGQVFVVGSHADSFDSRYWGFIPLNNLQPLRVIW
jgi:conjugal transfer pilin signal peptidase TrbI